MKCGVMASAVLRRWWLVSSCAVMIAWVGPAGAAKIETLLMPGKVIEGHAKYEAECAKCHTRLSKKTQSNLCLDCHKEVAKDVAGKAGFHGRLRDIHGRECRECHTDHKGRDFDIVRLDRATFDHQATDFALRGSHATVRCSACHKAGDDGRIVYRKAPGTCYSCHEGDDVHKGRLGKKCKKCHNERSWRKESSFNHDKTDFPLRGKHREVKCAACHPNERYKDIPTQCAVCHAINDVHLGRYGRKCADCHSEKDWKKVKFDHDRDTKYKLRGRHAEVKCDSCHTGKIHDKLQTKCIACHRNDDAHKERYGDKCKECHTEKRWRDVSFDHGKDTKYPLRGRHKKVACYGCHTGKIHDKLPLECHACHKVDDVHKGQQGERCQDCHNERAWGKGVRFDHDITRFPLLGLHAIVSCQDCHLTSAYKDVGRECIGCHKKDDEHKGRLGKACAMCHNPNAWNIWSFDHNKRTKFKLDGAHKKLHCYACHRVPSDDAGLPMSCHLCHEEDDVHRGRFGERCEQCHNTSSFKQVTFTR